MPTTMPSRRGGGGGSGGGGRGSSVSTGRGGASRRGMGNRHHPEKQFMIPCPDDIDEAQTGLACQQFWDVNAQVLRPLGLTSSAHIRAEIQKDSKGAKFRFKLPISLTSPEKQQLATSYKKTHHHKRSVLVIIESHDTEPAELMRERAVKVPYMTIARDDSAQPAQPASAKPARQALAEISNMNHGAPVQKAQPRFAQQQQQQVLQHQHQHLQQQQQQRVVPPPPFPKVHHQEGVMRQAASMPGSLATKDMMPCPPPAAAELPGLVSLPSSGASTPREMECIPALLSMDTVQHAAQALSLKQQMVPKAVFQAAPDQQSPQQQQQQPQQTLQSVQAPPVQVYGASPQQAVAHNPALPQSQHLPNTRMMPSMPRPQAKVTVPPPSHYHPPLHTQHTTHNPYGTLSHAQHTQHQHQHQHQQHQQHQQQHTQHQQHQQQHQHQQQQQVTQTAQHAPAMAPPQSVGPRAAPAPAPAVAAAPASVPAPALVPVPAPACSPPIPVSNISNLHSVPGAAVPCATANEVLNLIDQAGSVTTFSIVSMDKPEAKKLVWSGGKNGHTVVRKVTVSYELNGMELGVDSSTVTLRFPEALPSVKKLKQMCESLKNSVACNMDLSWTNNTDKWKRTTTTNNETRVAYDPYAVSPAKPSASAMAQQQAQHAPPPQQFQAPPPQQQQQQQQVSPQAQSAAPGRSLLPESNYVSDALLVRQGSHASPGLTQSPQSFAPATPSQRNDASPAAASTPASLRKLNANAAPFVPGGAAPRDDSRSPEPAQPPVLCKEPVAITLEPVGAATTPRPVLCGYTALATPKEYQFVAIDEDSHDVVSHPEGPVVRRLKDKGTVVLVGVQSMGAVTWGKISDDEWCLLTNPVEGRTYLQEVTE